MDLIKKFLKKDRVALSKLISLVENGHSSSLDILSSIHHKTGHAQVLGITGPPGAGKSTLINQLIKYILNAKKSAAILATDPSSPFTGGAILGDRIRMQEHVLEKNIYVRSISTRGSHGGLSRATFDTIQLMDAFGFDFIIVETVGVGQTELDIMRYADTTILVLVPESGDHIQTMKAGIMEIADVFVINKMDRTGAESLKSSLQEMVGKKNSPIILTQALENLGIADLWRIIQERKKTLGKNGKNRLKSQRTEEVIKIVLSELEKAMRGQKKNSFYKIFKEVSQGKINPYKAAQKILKNVVV